MAKYTITRACGHEEVAALFGKQEDRRWRLENVESKKLCYECWQRQLREEQEKEALEAAKAAREMDLPPLTGTEKQVAWAEVLRQQLIAAFDMYLDFKHKLGKGDPKLRAAIEHIKATRTEARWWIDNRELVHRRHEIKDVFEDALAELFAPAAPQEVIEEAVIEATVRPENPITETV